MLITPLDSAQLCAIADPHTTDLDCVSVQSILSHIVQPGYSYTVYIEHAVGQHNAQHPVPQTAESGAEYVGYLREMYDYCERCFQKNTAAIALHLDNDKRINTAWGQYPTYTK